MKTGTLGVFIDPSCISCLSNIGTFQFPQPRAKLRYICRAKTTKNCMRFDDYSKMALGLTTQHRTQSMFDLCNRLSTFGAPRLDHYKCGRNSLERIGTTWWFQRLSCVRDIHSHVRFYKPHILSFHVRQLLQVADAVIMKTEDSRIPSDTGFKLRHYRYCPTCVFLALFDMILPIPLKMKSRRLAKTAARVNLLNQLFFTAACCNRSIVRQPVSAVWS